ncbi:papain-like cysteine protease family protein [Candidatus Nitrotoga fabula]|uniref:Papain like cysteine protease AvrRpt2 n=1 Tax=Candidatus Nitrotoga fabula TaxID=2182327 RepID=A0A916FAD7_9PROT|nr:papain-like cysteine protease family protein [Candidatus Nitrotoga fabula]CAE6715270.1 Papain like cysteine protease AvrRpt2 [Candidatus Nitrotoga fabula]
MLASEFISVTSRPYSSLLRELFILGRLFSAKHLPFNMQAQTQSNWCWAATSTSVSHFYWFLSPWTQCRVANGELNHNDCCNSPVPSPCNVPWYLDKALTRTNNFVNITGQVSFQQVRDEIDAGRPVGARIGWGGGGGHFMVIYGYSVAAGVEYFDIDDPIYGKTHLTVSDFSTNYQGSGNWTHTYFTKSYFKMPPIKILIPNDPILRRIWEARPLLRMKQDTTFTGEIRDMGQESHATLGMAQRIYSLGLDSLIADHHPELKPVGLRVYEMSEDMPQAFFDVTEEDEPRLLQMSMSKNHLEPFVRGLAQALSTAEKSNQECELRLLRVPALNFEALWLSFEGEAKDVLVPLRAVGRLTPHKIIHLDEAYDTLREAARALPKMDDAMGS